MITCPCCKEKITFTLSICPECKAILDNNVDFQDKPHFTENPNKNNLKGNSLNTKIMSNEALTNQSTSEISSKQTSPTLIEFPNKNVNLPEWRLKLQSVVREHKESVSKITTVPTTTRRKAFTGSSASLAIDVIECQKQPKSANPLLEMALRRIEKSREVYREAPLETSLNAPITKPTMIIKPVQAKTYNFTLPKTNIVDSLPIKPIETSNQHVTETSGISEKQSTFKAPIKSISINETKLVEDANTPIAIKPKIERFKTNKLPKLTPAKLSSSLGRLGDYIGLSNSPTISPINGGTQPQNLSSNTISPSASEEIDDIAPLSMRFNATLFDLIIGTSLSLVLLSPVMLLGGNWFNIEGLFAFLATCSIVMFIYLTTAIGLLGKTFGMQLFSLEMVDINDGDFPTFHQAAVSSSVYLLSLALLGVGFATIFLNDEQRAAHDLFSGTIVIKEM